MTQYDIYGIGNALVDVETRVTREFLQENDVHQGCMTLVDSNRQNHLLDQLRRKIEHKSCGGSVANSVIAAASFGSRCFLSCVVADDEMGRFFHRDLRHRHISTNLDKTGLPLGDTGTCLVMITPDADRTMNTFLGIGGEVGPAHLDDEAIAQSKICFLEGYQISSDVGLEAMDKLIHISNQNDRYVALSLSDPNLVSHFRNEFIDLAKGRIQLSFMNEEEALAISQGDTLPDAIEWLKAFMPSFVITRGAKGSIGWDGNQLHQCDVPTVHKLDTNGAGDMFAGTFLHCLLRDADFDVASKAACYSAGLVVAQYGPRLEPQNHRKASQFVNTLLNRPEL